MIRRVLAFLGRFVAVVLSGLMGLGCFVAGIWSDDPIPSIIFFCIGAVCFFIVRLVFGLLDRPLDEDVDRWLALYGPIVLCVIAAWGVNFEYRSKNHPPRQVSKYNDLYVSTGVLSKGIGYNFLLKRKGPPDLKLICADRSDRVGSCDYEKKIPFIGAQVIVLHEATRKPIRSIAEYYEIKAGNEVIISYAETVAGIRYNEQIWRRVDYSIWIMFIIMGLYMPIEYAIRRRRENKRHKMLDESVPATQ